MTDGAPASGAISSASNARVKAALELRERKGRERAGRLLVDGGREVGRALDAGVEVVEAFVSSEPRDAAARDTIDRLSAAGVPLVEVSGPAEARLAYGDRRSEVVAVVRMPAADLAHLSRALDGRPDPLVVVLEDPEKPGNLGAVARSADGAGADALIAATYRGPAADPWNPNAVRASVGDGPEPAARRRSHRGRARLAAGPPDPRPSRRACRRRSSTSRSTCGARWRSPSAPRRTASARPGWRTGSPAVRLPMLGRGDSLNVSAAARRAALRGTPPARRPT